MGLNLGHNTKLEDHLGRELLTVANHQDKEAAVEHN